MLSACRLALGSSGTWPCTVHLVPTPRPLPSSVSVELSGAYTRQEPGRSTAAHAAKQHAVVALSDAGQLLSRAASKGPSHNTSDAQRKVGTLGVDSLVVVFVVVVVLLWWLCWLCWLCCCVVDCRLLGVVVLLLLSFSLLFVVGGCLWLFVVVCGGCGGFGTDGE